jgi:hypothetical protein
MVAFAGGGQLWALALVIMAAVFYLTSGAAEAARSGLARTDVGDVAAL